MSEEQKKAAPSGALVGALVALLVAAVVEIGIALAQLARNPEKGLEQPVTMRTFLAVLIMQFLAIAYLLAKVIWLGVPAVLG